MKNFLHPVILKLTGVTIFIFCLIPHLAEARWNVGISAGHYFLGFGGVNNDLEQNYNKKYGTHLR